jgi:hypothetical protein
MKTRFTLEEVQDYLYCSLLYYLKHRKGAAELNIPALTTADLPGEAINQALRVFSAGDHPQLSFRALVQAVWATWMKQKGIGADTITMLLGYESMRREILDQFLSGKITKRGGGRYTEPRLSTRYRQMTEHAGLQAVAARIEEQMLPRFQVASAELDLLGEYLIADAYADSLLMAARYPLPPREAIAAADEDITIRSRNNIQIQVKAHLLIKGKSGTIAVVAESEPAFYFNPTWAGRNLAAIALSLYDGAGHSEKPVHKILIRHLMSGKDVARKRLRTSRLSLALLHGVRGIQADLYLPQFLSGDLSRCRRCPAERICLDADEDPIEAAYPGTLAWSERVIMAAEKIGRHTDPAVGDLVRAIGQAGITAQDLTRFWEGRADER